MKHKENSSHTLVLVASVVYPLTTMGQVLEIFVDQSATNISLITYVLYIFFTIVFLVYGIREKLTPIIVLQSLWLVMYSLSRYRRTAIQIMHQESLQ